MALTLEQFNEYQAIREHWRVNPVLYMQQRFGRDPTKQQKQFLEAIAQEGAKVSVRAGHGVGKTAAVSCIIWWHLECFDFCRIPCTAPTYSQLYNILWGELSKWQRFSDEQSLKKKLPSELWLSNLFYCTKDRIADIARPTEWYAVARTSRKETPDALQGFHASDIKIDSQGNAIHQQGSAGSILFVIEEASGVPDEIFEVAEGALTSPGARLLMVGNPTRNNGFFARSQKQDRSLYTTLHFSCQNSPLVDPHYRINLVKKYGEDSNVVRVRADGEFPKQDDDVLIPLELSEAMLTREVREVDNPIYIGLDVARFGDDRSVLIARCGPAILDIKVMARQDLMQTVGETVNFARMHQADCIFVDVVGVGAGVYDRLYELDIGIEIIDVNVAEKAPAMIDELDATIAKPARLRDYLWMQGHEWLKKESPFIKDGTRLTEYANDLAGELSSIRYGFDSSGNILVESKDVMKKRGLRSPDLADALCLTFAPRGSRIIDKWMALGES